MIRRVDKPWGHEIVYAHTERYAGKLLFIRAGERLSLQYHRLKDETIYVISGELDLVIEERGSLSTRRLGPGEGCHIASGVRHRMIAVADCRVAETSTPELDDVVRLEDAYGRAEAPVTDVAGAATPAGDTTGAGAAVPKKGAVR